MPFSFVIALRYFFSKNEQTIINLINRISIGVVMVATASLLIVLSAFSGLKEFGLSFSNSFDPDFRVSAAYGKTFSIDSLQLRRIKSLPNVIAATPIIEDKVFLRFKEKNQVAFIKGVEEDYPSVVHIDSLIMSGNWFVNEFDEVILGGGIARNLSVGVYDYTEFLSLSAPRRKATSSLIKDPFNTESALVAGIYFANEEIDKKFLFAKMDLAKRLLQRSDDEFTSLEIKAAAGLNQEDLTRQILAIMGEDVIIRNRAQLNAALYKMLNTENIAVYLIFSLIIIIALFNVVGALIMMFLDKKPQLRIFLAMGLVPKEIQQIFFYLGALISWFGGFLGIIIGSVLVFVQQMFPFLYVPGTSLPYPVKFELTNFFTVVITLVVLGAITSYWATRKMDKQL